MLQYSASQSVNSRLQWCHFSSCSGRHPEDDEADADVPLTERLSLSLTTMKPVSLADSTHELNSFTGRLARDWHQERVQALLTRRVSDLSSSADSSLMLSACCRLLVLHHDGGHRLLRGRPALYRPQSGRLGSPFYSGAAPARG